MNQGTSGNYPPISYDEMLRASELFWSKNKLAVDSNGKTYRTNIPRKAPQDNFNYKSRKKRYEGKLQLQKAHRN
jgi:hypothetical protein